MNDVEEQAESGPYILYVDDERGNRVVFEQSFRSMFPFIRTATSGEEALELLEEVEVGVLVADQRMPGMSGNDLLAVAKQLYPDIVRIVVTAYEELDPVLRAVNEGLAARYLLKPWDRKELAEILNWALETYRAGKLDVVLQRRLIETERLAVVGSVTAAILHDMNTPLSYMSEGARRLLELVEASESDLQGLVPAGQTPDPAHRGFTTLVHELPELADDLHTGCETLIVIARGLQKLLGRRRNGMEPAQPVTAIRYATSVCRSVATAAKAQVAYEGPASLPPVALDSGELIQVLVNLLTNALDAVGRRTMAGGMVVLRAEADASGVRLQVQDNGVGMEPDVLERLGRPFFTTREAGTGLGVFQCQRLVRQAGGALDYESQVGTGTTATLELPISPHTSGKTVPPLG